MGDVITGVPFRPRKETIRGAARCSLADAFREVGKPVGVVICVIGEGGTFASRSDHCGDVELFDLLSRAEAMLQKWKVGLMAVD